MKQTIHIYITLIVSAALMVFFVGKAEQLRFNDRKNDVGDQYLKRTKMLTGGFDAVASDLLWLKTNLSDTRIKSKKKTKVSEDVRLKLAQKSYQDYKKVVDLDPTFKQAYKYGVLGVMTELPDEAIDLARQAMANLKKDKKEFSELAGYISYNIKKDYSLAKEFYAKSVEGGPRRDFIGRNYLRTLVRLAKVDPYSEKLAEIYKIIRIYESAHKDLVVSSEVEGTDIGSQQESSWVKPHLEKNITDFLSRTGLEKHNVDTKLIAAVKKIYESLKPAGNVCERCYHLYEAGDKFCANCGLGVQVFGVCSTDGTVLKGSFCHKCGVKSSKVINTKRTAL